MEHAPPLHSRISHTCVWSIMQVAQRRKLRFSVADRGAEGEQCGPWYVWC